MLFYQLNYGGERFLQLKGQEGIRTPERRSASVFKTDAITTLPPARWHSPPGGNS